MENYTMWLFGDDVGVSSKTILLHLLDLPNDHKFHPLDPSDFGRCYRLLKKFPELENNIEKLRSLGRKWNAFVDIYPLMCKLWEKESPTGICPKLYQLMQEKIVNL